LIGDFINALLSFILIAAAVYFFIVVPVNAFMARMRRGEAPPDPTTKKCPECLSEVAIAARRLASVISHELNEFNEFNSLNSLNSWLIFSPESPVILLK
jgi:hypothetical protein